MVGFVVGLIVVVCLVGGLFYGYCYLSAKANKKSVSGEIVGKLTNIVKKDEQN